MTANDKLNFNPIVSPDGSSILYQQADEKNLVAFWKIGIDGATPVQLTKIDSSYPDVSPHGRFFVSDYGAEKARTVSDRRR